MHPFSRGPMLFALSALLAACEMPTQKPPSTQELQSNPYGPVSPSPYSAYIPPLPILPATPAPTSGHVIVVKAGRFLDGTLAPPKSDVAVVIDGERIVKIGPMAQTEIPSGASVIDLSQATVLPGLIDCHVHLGSRADRYEELSTFKDTPFTSAFAAVNNARATLEAGFTSVRDLSSLPFLSVDLRRSIDEGSVVGPRIVASGPGISSTGGHGDLNGYSPQTSLMMFPAERDYQYADGVEQVRHVVRAQIKYGVDVVKIFASGGVLSGDSPSAQQFTFAELKVAAEEAHMAGRKLAVHAHGTQAIKDAVNAGADSIEHGSMIDDEGIKLMKQHGTWLVADIYNDDYILTKAKELKIPDDLVKTERAIGQLQRDNFAKAVRAGVKVAFGTDAGVYPHGDNAKQFAYMVKYGLTSQQAIKAATSDAAELIGKSADLGTLAPGKYADLVGVSGDPLSDVRVLERVGFVMKGGKVFKDNLTKGTR